MALAIRGRSIEHDAGERVRLSEAVREIQKDLSYVEAWIGRQRSRRVAEYRDLVDKTREGPGSARDQEALLRRRGFSEDMDEVLQVAQAARHRPVARQAIAVERPTTDYGAGVICP